MKRVVSIVALCIFAVIILVALNSNAATSTPAEPGAVQADTVTLDQVFQSPMAFGCTSADCEVCNRNKLQCVPNGPNCDCVPWTAIE